MVSTAAWRGMAGGAWMCAVVVAVAACGSASPPGITSSAGSAHPCGGVASGAVTVSASTYVMSLVVGPTEAMYSSVEVASKHPTTGEVMLRGTMNMQGNAGSGAGMSMSGDMSGMNMSGSTSAGQVRHLELHICTQSGIVVTDANPSIRLRDATDGGTVTVPIAVMEGVTSGTSDLHYGNNVSLTLGDTYYADVAVNGVSTTLRLPPA